MSVQRFPQRKGSAELNFLRKRDRQGKASHKDEVDRGGQQPCRTKQARKCLLTRGMVMVLQAAEIRTGLAAFIEPEKWLEHGGECLAPPWYRIKGPHFFVCLAALEWTSVWTALTSKAGWSGRLEIVSGEKLGHPTWVETSTFVAHPNQTWYGPSYGLREASQHDVSLVGERNYVSDQCLNRLMLHCRFPSPERLAATLDSRLLTTLGPESL